VPGLLRLARFGCALIPVDVAAHLAHNLFHLLAEGGSVHCTLAVPFGGTASRVDPSRRLAASTRCV